MNRRVGKIKTRVEPLGSEVGYLEGMRRIGLNDPVANGLGKRMGQRIGVMVSNDDKGMHVEIPSGVEQCQAGMLG
jgi:hypothetical protein